MPTNGGQHPRFMRKKNVARGVTELNGLAKSKLCLDIAEGEKGMPYSDIVVRNSETQHGVVSVH
jgi:hypothetical protein